jgi:hypothetical protein
MPTMTEMQQAALELHAARVATNKIRDHEERMAALRALQPVVANGVTVWVVVPSNRTISRRPHTRFEYRLNGKIVTEATARDALAAT